MKYCLAIGLFMYACFASAQPVEQIQSLFQKQTQAWNQGDVDGYMQSYWRSDKLQFVSRGELVYGWDELYRRYKKSYPNKAAMGELSFDIQSVKSLSDNAALVSGQWTLARDKDQPTGASTLLIERIDGQWLITHDHSSD
ncbi:SgcJ/EcaC family oxidoreductase [Shewanella sp. WXL01]|uniref:YybH family protein n=1 Tax=Shewanella sp. WXL01 TaxID=2709721 RepID=UPI0014383A98|nr:SgcJ/EcaC family oxidoreductase [Shewanella sp. WXL01]NKF52068.1 SgcJ/EcaC family oxidoreductase [Shewanella sp. WXL01]